MGPAHAFKHVAFSQGPYMALHLAWWVHRLTSAKQVMCRSVIHCLIMLSCRSVMDRLPLSSLGMLPSELGRQRARGPEARKPLAPMPRGHQHGMLLYESQSLCGPECS